MLCAPGSSPFSWPSGEFNCSACPPGTYSSTGATCDYAPAGHFAPRSGLAEVFQCGTRMMTGAVTCPDPVPATSTSLFDEFDIIKYIDLGMIPAGYHMVSEYDREYLALCPIGFTSGLLDSRSKCLPCPVVMEDREALPIDAFLCKEDGNRESTMSMTSQSSRVHGRMELEFDTLNTDDFPIPSAAKNWTGMVIHGVENSHSQYDYVAILFETVYQVGFYGNTRIGNFSWYESYYDQYLLTGGEVCEAPGYFGVQRQGTASFRCSKKTSFSVFESPTCYYTLHYFSPVFCADGTYPYQSDDPTLEPTRQPSASPTLLTSHTPAYATLSADYVKDVLLTMGNGYWAAVVGWSANDALTQFENIRVDVDSLTGMLSSPLEIYHDSDDSFGAIPSELNLLKNCVSVLSLASSGLSSTIPSFLGDFVYLQRLVLFDNCLTGTIPLGLGSNTAIREIYLESNRLHGSLPSDLFSFAQIVMVSSNSLTGSLPSYFGENLEEFYATANYFSGPIPTTINTSYSLVSFDVSHNWMTGKMPKALCDISFYELKLGWNNFGCYPSCLNVGSSDVTTTNYWRCPSEVDTAICDIASALNVAAAVKDQYGALDEVTYETDHQLDFVWEHTEIFDFNDEKPDYVEVSFACESQLSACMVRLYDKDGVSVFDATDSSSFAIPGCGSESPLHLSLTYLKMVYSNWEPLDTWGFEVTVTPFKAPGGWNCTSVSYPADFYDDVYDDYTGGTNHPKGPYAAEYCTWYGVTCSSGVTLESLDLSQLGLVGTLPSTMAALGTISSLNLAYNCISGTLPSSLVSLEYLRELDLQTNYISGTLPSELGELSTLQVLSLSSNFLTGNIPNSFGDLTSIVKMDLSTNTLSGKMSPGLCPLAVPLAGDQARAIKLQDNQITCYESECYSSYTASQVFRFDADVHFCAPTSTPTGAPSVGSLDHTAIDSTSSTSLSTGSIIALAVCLGIFLCCATGGVYHFFVRRWDRIQYFGLPLHFAAVRKLPITEEMLTSHRTTINELVNGKSLVDLILQTPGSIITPQVLSKLVIMRIMEEDTRQKEDEVMMIASHGGNGGDTAAVSSQRNEAGSKLNMKLSAKIFPVDDTAINQQAQVAELEGESAAGAPTDEKLVDASSPKIVVMTSTKTKYGVPGANGGVRGADVAGDDQQYPDWVSIIQLEGRRYQETVYLILQALPERIKDLCDCRDSHGRRCLDIASHSVKQVMLRCGYLCYRYELQPAPWEHTSATSAVIFAVDHGPWSFTVIDDGTAEAANGVAKSNDGDMTERSEHNTKSWNSNGSSDKDVCLKFMRNREQFANELETRKRCALDSDYVISILSDYDSDACGENELTAIFRRGAIAQGLANYPYCIVMNRAEQSLKRIIDHSHIVGEDWDAIKTMFKQVVNCVDHMHSRKLIHGDLKPMNIMRAAGKMILIDLDASTRFTTDPNEEPTYAGSKFSSAYSPPELICIGDDGNATVRVPPPPVSATPSGKTAPARKQVSYDLVKASPSLDCWALGGLLYLLCTGMTLFRATVEDNVGCDADLRSLMEWSIQTKDHTLSVVKDKLARNLISLLLSKDPSKRLSCSHILSHPFLTGKSPGRLQGETPKYDVFLSYRVSSDSDHVKRLHDMLEATGLKVWWDKKCLLPGQPWEEGFCAGLADAGHFVCLLSRGGINSDTKPWENFTKLEAGSRCDNVLLEWRLALELKRRGMIEGVFPVMIGDSVEDMETHSVSYTHYFGSGCHPSKLPTIAVTSVETKLLEHLDREGLGQPYEETMTVSAVVGEVLANQGGFIVGNPESSWSGVVTEVRRMIDVTNVKRKREVVEETNITQNVRPSTAGGANVTASTTMSIADLVANNALLVEENNSLKKKLQGYANGSLTIN